MKFVDSLLQPFVVQAKSYIKDTTDFISKVEGTPVPATSVILSFDVTSLYTCIPQEDARAVVEYFFSCDDYQGPPIHYVLQLVDTLLEKNYFRYQEDYYL